MGLYRRRHLERSDYYRLLESGFEEFARNWPEHFEARYSFLLKEVQSAVFSFLECGIHEKTVWRVCAAPVTDTTFLWPFPAWPSEFVRTARASVLYCSGKRSWKLFIP